MSMYGDIRGAGRAVVSRTLPIAHQTALWGQFTQPDPIGLAGGLNLYGYAGGDPVNFSDPYGLCKDKDGNERDCVVRWLDEASNQAVDPEVMAVLQDLATTADVDLYLSSGRRAEGSNCGGSRHNCGLAADISKIGSDGGIIDIGQGRIFNEGASGVVQRVQQAAFGHAKVRENFGPMGLWKTQSVGGTPQVWASNNSALYWSHRNHIHISINR